MTTTLLTDMMLLTPTASTSAPYPDADLLLSPWPRSFSADWADALSAERLPQALDATAESLLPQTPRCDWSVPKYWFAEDADLETEETFPVNPLDEATRRKRARSEEKEEGECDEEEEEEGARSEEEGEYYCREEATPRPPPSPINYSPFYAEEEAPSPAEAPSPIIDASVEAPRVVRVFFSGQRLWEGAAAPKKRAPKKAPKPMRVALPVDTTLARGAPTHGAEARRRLIEVARELRGASKGWADAIEETINLVVLPADAPTLSFGNGADDDLDLRRSGKGVARHAATIMDALDHLRAPENAAAAAERGLLVRWPECLPRGVLRCAELHAYLDAWASGASAH